MYYIYQKKYFLIWFFFFFSSRLEEDGVLTDCSIKTMEPDEVLDFDFCSTNVVNKIIMKVNSIFFQDRKVFLKLLSDQKLSLLKSGRYEQNFPPPILKSSGNYDHLIQCFSDLNKLFQIWSIRHQRKHM